MSLTIRAYTAPDGTVVGEVADGERVVATCMGGWDDHRDALRAAEAKRAVIQAERDRVMNRPQRTQPYNNGFNELVCTCNRELWRRGELWACEGPLWGGERHWWKRTDEGWERVDERTRGD